MLMPYYPKYHFNIKDLSHLIFEVIQLSIPYILLKGFKLFALFLLCQQAEVRYIFVGGTMLVPFPIFPSPFSWLLAFYFN